MEGPASVRRWSVFLIAGIEETRQVCPIRVKESVSVERFGYMTAILRRVPSDDFELINREDWLCEGQLEGDGNQQADVPGVEAFVVDEAFDQVV